MRNKKTLTILLIVMVLAVVLAPAIALADNFTGSVTITSNYEPTISAFTASAGLGAMSPTNVITFSLTVNDLDEFSNISKVMVMFWHTTTAGAPTDLKTIVQSENDSTVENWIEVYDGATFNTDLTNTTWSAENLNTSPANPTGSETSFVFNFTVTIGQEAMEVDPTDHLSDTNKWVVAAKVTDAQGNTAFALPEGYETTPLSRSWFGLMTASGDARPEWTSGTPGMSYSDDTADSQIFDNTYTLFIRSNGDYSFDVSTVETWTNDTTSINYNTDMDTHNQFSLAIDTQDVYNFTGTAQELTYSGGGTTTPIRLTPSANWGTGTDYAGIYITDIYMFLQTYDTMTETNGDNYEGIVTFTLVQN